MDEENNNNAKKVVEEGKKIAKEALKEGTKEIRSKIIAWALPVLGWAALILLIIGALNLIVYEIRSFFLGKTPTPNPDDETIVASAQMQSLVSFGENGEYILNEDYAEDLIKELEEKSIDPEELGYITSSGENMIDKYIKVELQTMLPKTNAPGNDFDGLIKIQRVKADGTPINLDYISYKKYKDNGSTLEDWQFTIDPETFKILILGGSTTTQYWDLNGNTVSGITSEDDRAAEIEEIDYQAMTQNYGVPFNFLITIHSFAQNVNFMNDVVDEILKNDEAIVLSYVESQTIETTTKVYTGKDDIYIREDVTTSEGETQRGWWHYYDQKEINNGNVRSYNSRLNIDLTWAKKEKTTKTYSINITKADTWLKKTEKELKEQSTPETQIGEIVVNSYSAYYEEDGETIENQPEGGETKIKYQHNVHVDEEITTTGKNNNITIIDKDSEIKVDDFVDLIKTYPRVRNNFETAPSNIFSLLQETEDTQTLEKIMRYVIYKLSGINYGVTEADLDSLFPSDKYVYINSFQLLKQNIRYWEYFTTPPKNADGTKYIIYDDGTGKAVVGYGVEVEKYKDLFISEGYPTEIGGEVDVEFVDDIEEKEIQDRKSKIQDLTTELKLNGPQISALVMRSYAFDNPSDAVNSLFSGMNFIDSYKTYWDPEKDSKTKEKTTQADFKHNLYVEYMSQPMNATGSQNTSIVQRRRQSEWTLFQTGYFEALGKWQSAADFDVDTVAAAGYVFPHYLQANYPGPYGTSTIPRSACGAVSLAMILAGLLQDASIDPYTVVANINDNWPNGSYYVPGQGSSHCIFWSSFLEKYYGVTSEACYENRTKAMQALEAGYPVIGGESGHILALIPAPDEYKSQGYKFFILDSARGHSGPCRSFEEAGQKVRRRSFVR